LRPFLRPFEKHFQQLNCSSCAALQAVFFNMDDDDGGRRGDSAPANTGPAMVIFLILLGSS
jgi:hypothetical protein